MSQKLTLSDRIYPAYKIETWIGSELKYPGGLNNTLEEKFFSSQKLEIALSS